MPTVHGFAFAKVACKDPEGVAQTWSKLLELPLRKEGNTTTIALNDAGEPPTELRFCALEPGQNEGVVGVGLYTKGQSSEIKRVVGVDFSMVPLASAKL